MLIVITPEHDVKDETKIINDFFELNLEALHLRKPFYTINEYEAYLADIKKEYHHKIVLHEAHELCEVYELKGVHLQEQFRKDLKNDLKDYVSKFKSCKRKRFSVSSSFHDKESINKCNVVFDYYLLSPVFNAISKKGYKGKGFDVNDIQATIIGMGGVTTETMKTIFDLGFKGAGVLGSVWNVESPTTAFKQLKTHHDNYIIKK